MSSIGEIPTARRATSRGKFLKAAGGAAFGLLLLYATVRHVEWARVREAWENASVPLIVLGLASLAAGFTVRIIRWWWMLRALDDTLPLANCARPFLASLAINNTVPLRAGDVFRAVGFRAELRVPPAEVLSTLVVERVLDMFALLTVFFVGLLGVARGAVPPAFVTAGLALFACCFAGLLVLVLAPSLVQRLVAFVLARAGTRPFAVRASAVAGQFFTALTRILTPVRALQLIVFSAVAWGFEGGMYAAVAAALHAGGSPSAPWFALSTGTLATLLPSSPGYVGTFDYFAILGLVSYGVVRATAAAVALLVHVMLWLPPTLVGAACFFGPRTGVAWSSSKSAVAEVVQ
jgi:uncharacterized protein (TIRG00374 family)